MARRSEQTNERRAAAVERGRIDSFGLLREAPKANVSCPSPGAHKLAPSRPVQFFHCY